MKSAALKPEYDPINRMYKIEEGGKKFYLPLKSLESLEKFYDSFVPNSKVIAPSVTNWYNSLSRPEQADILVMKRRDGTRMTRMARMARMARMTG